MEWRPQTHEVVFCNSQLLCVLEASPALDPPPVKASRTMSVGCELSPVVRLVLRVNWKRVMDEAKDQQLIVSYKILDGNLPGKDEWNMMLLVEQKNWGAFDGAAGKFDAIAEKMVGPEKAQMESMIKRSDMREIVGVRNFQEVNFK